jgi:hypothetical protein
MIPDAKTPKITKIANLLYDIFKKNYLFYLDQGYINFQFLCNISYLYPKKQYE